MQNGKYLTTQLPVSFATGSSSFAVPVNDLFPRGGQCAESAYRLLGKEHHLGCSLAGDDIDLELCTDEGALSCASISPRQLQQVLRLVVRGFYEARKLSDQLRKRHPVVNRGFSIVRESTLATEKIQNVLANVESQLASCGPDKKACMQVEFPRQEILRLFRNGFRPRAPVGRIPFRALVGRLDKRLQILLGTFPRTIVVCGD